MIAQLGHIENMDPYDAAIADIEDCRNREVHFFLAFQAEDDSTMICTTITPKERIGVLEDLLLMHKTGMN